MLDFDPTYGYTLEQLLQIAPPPEPDDFKQFWLSRYLRAMAVDPIQRLEKSSLTHPDFECYGISYRSTGDFQIGGWILIPKQMPIKRGVIVGHGYGGRDGPDIDLPIIDAVFLFPCFRGLSQSKHPSISDNPSYHVLHNIDNRDEYIIGECVEDLWLAVSALLNLFPAIAGHLAYLGISLGGGIGALALPWDNRIQRAHFNVPSFGNNPLRLQLPTFGSAAAVQLYQQTHCNILDTLRYFDAAIAANNINAPVHVAAALSDPVVAPPGQFCIYNALPCEKELFVLEKGHSDYPNQDAQRLSLMSELEVFLKPL